MLVTLVCSAAGFFGNFFSLEAIPPQTGQSLTCSTRSHGNQEIFNVYVTDVSIARMAVDRLCTNDVVKRQYGQVTVIIGQSDYDTYRYINHGVVDLALVKSNAVQAFGADRIYGMTRLASYPDYSAFFIALRERPTLSKEYLLGKRLGLLDYPSSRSGHIVPKTIIQNLGLSESTISMVYYNTHQELRRALLAGEVDIISSYWANEDNLTFSSSYATPLQDSVSGMQWYLKMQMRNTDLYCAMQETIVDIARSHPRPYYQNIEIAEGCSE